MDERDDRKPARAAPRADRAERLKAALRANLKRRKAQARGRAEFPETAGPEKETPHPTPDPKDR